MPGSDRRKTARRRTFLAGRLSVDKLETFDVGCTVRNISEGGARLALTQPALVPSAFRLGISGAAGQRGRLVWYRGGEMGIAFGEAQAANLPTSPPDPAADPMRDEAPSLRPLQLRMQAIVDRRRVAGGGFTRP